MHVLHSTLHPVQAPVRRLAGRHPETVLSAQHGAGALARPGSMLGSTYSAQDAVCTMPGRPAVLDPGGAQVADTQWACDPAG